MGNKVFEKLAGNGACRARNLLAEFSCARPAPHENWRSESVFALLSPIFRASHSTLKVPVQNKL